MHASSSRPDVPSAAEEAVIAFLRAPYSSDLNRSKTSAAKIFGSRSGTAAQARAQSVTASPMTSPIAPSESSDRS